MGEEFILVNGRLRKVEICVATMGTEMSYIKGDIKEVKEDIKDIKRIVTNAQISQSQQHSQLREDRECQIRIDETQHRERELSTTFKIASMKVKKDYFVAIVTFLGTLASIGLGYLVASAM